MSVEDKDEDDDDYAHVFGVGSDLSGASLWIGFFSVAAYLLIFSGLLDKLENVTSGTSYHLMLRRIYREIMMVGLGSFAFTILNQMNAVLPYGMSQAIGFADICCFAMASFFCLQGVLIMLASIKQAKNWNIASQIPAEELLHNMSMWELSHPLAWRARYLPLCPTREQVEFRVLKSIFATAYNIKASHSEFDFSIFLRMTHEKNILKIMDISYKNWFFILVLIGFAALKLYFWESNCTTEACEIREEIAMFAIFGSVYGVVSIALWLWGRLLELRLISSVGVQNVNDYPIFLKTELRTEETLSNCAASPVLVKDVISNFMKGEEVKEVVSKEVQYVHRRSLLKRVVKDEHDGDNKGRNNLSLRIKRLILNGSLRQKVGIEEVVEQVLDEMVCSKTSVEGGGRCDDEKRNKMEKWSNESSVKELTCESIVNKDKVDSVAHSWSGKRDVIVSKVSDSCALTSFDAMDTLDSVGVTGSDAASLKDERIPVLRVKPTPTVNVAVSNQSTTVKKSDGSRGKVRPAKMKRLSSEGNVLLNRGMSMIVKRRRNTFKSSKKFPFFD